MYKNKWVPLNGKPTHPIPRLGDVTDCKVGDLIHHDSKEWKVDIIMDTFELNSARAILAIALARGCTEDTLFWGHNKNGLYTVRSGY